MKGYVANIEQLTQENENFRKVLYTARHLQLVLMNLKPGEDIGEEVHEGTDQFIRCESGEGKAVLDGVELEVKDGFVVVVPAGMRHNVLNTSQIQDMKLYTLYGPSHHTDQVLHATKKEAEADDEHFEGVTTE